MNFFLLRYIHTAPELQSNVQREMKERLSLMMALQTLGLNNSGSALWLPAFYTAALKHRRTEKPLKLHMLCIYALFVASRLFLLTLGWLPTSLELFTMAKVNITCNK